MDVVDVSVDPSLDVVVVSVTCDVDPSTEEDDVGISEVVESSPVAHEVVDPNSDDFY